MSLPAPLRDALLTDERLSSLTTWAPLLIAALVILALCWRDRGVPWPAEEPADPAWAPPTAPDLASPEDLRRGADRG